VIYTLAKLRLKILSDPANLAAVRQAIESLCAEHGFEKQACDDIGLCVNEALANVIRHAYDGATDRPIEITAHLLDPTALRIAIRDWGNGVDPMTLPHSSEKHDPLVPGGLGLICLQQMMDEVQFTPQADGGMLLEMIRRRRSNRKAV
jgi:serine/threonine-protein kinase RsbW